MKRRVVLLLACFAVSAVLAWPQTQAGPPAQPGHDHSQVHAQHVAEMQAACKQMLEEHTAEIKTTSKALSTNLAQMKATLPLISDINERSRWQSNIAMWQALAGHFNHMAEHAEHMQATGMSCGMMMGHGMGGDMDSEHTLPATPARPQ